MSLSHVIVIPSYNTGPILERTVREALASGEPVWLFIDGSDDGSHEVFLQKPEEFPGLRVRVSKKNRGKGATALWAAEEARREGVTHFLLMDADGQHPAEKIGEMIELSRKSPGAMILGQPIFGDDAPAIRLAGRKLSIAMTNFETFWGGLGDSLFGFRIYPVEPFLRAFAPTRYARRYDFDPEILVRLFWEGVPPVSLSVPVRYLRKEDGGVSHFHYLRDNVFMVWLHFRLLIAWVPQCIRVWKFSRQCRRRAIA